MKHFYLPLSKIRPLIQWQIISILFIFLMTGNVGAQQKNEITSNTNPVALNIVFNIQKQLGISHLGAKKIKHKQTTINKEDISIAKGKFQTANLKELQSVILPHEILQLKSAQLEKTITISPGGLSQAFPSNELSSITKLTIKGEMDARDFQFLRDNLWNIETLDLQEVSIEAYSGTKGTESTNEVKTYLKDAIPQFAFYHPTTYVIYHKLKNITLPSSITSIEESAFTFCKGVLEFKIPDSVVKIGRYAFYGCEGINAITIPENVTDIEEYTFSHCNELESIKLPTKLETIKEGLFWKSINLESVHLPLGLVTIESSAFNDCSGIKSIDFPTSLKKINDKAFFACIKLEEANLPSHIEFIGEFCFSYSALKTVTIPDKVLVLDEAAFHCCEKLKTAIINAPLLSIENSVFCGCTALTTISIPNTIKRIGDGTFLDVPT